jgi:hypothetical protein
MQAPRPAAARPPAEAIARFEQAGPGQDTRAQIPLPPVAAIANEAVEPTRRLSLDLPRSLHRRFKAACAKHDTKMIAEVMGFIERRTAELEREAAAD